MKTIKVKGKKTAGYSVNGQKVFYLFKNVNFANVNVFSIFLI